MTAELQSVDVPFVVEQEFKPEFKLTLPNTGQDVLHIPGAIGTVDPNYTLASSPDPAFPGPAAFLLDPNFSPTSLQPYTCGPGCAHFIGPRADAIRGSPAGTYRYRTTFDLTGTDVSFAFLNGSVYAGGDDISVELNGTPLGTTQFGSGRALAFSFSNVPSAFVPGLNVLDFVVTKTEFGAAGITVIFRPSYRTPLPDVPPDFDLIVSPAIQSSTLGSHSLSLSASIR